jgi:hypothetical protein
MFSLQFKVNDLCSNVVLQHPVARDLLFLC